MKYLDGISEVTVGTRNFGAGAAAIPFSGFAARSQALALLGDALGLRLRRP
jgi:hypothetical protein